VSEFEFLRNVTIGQYLPTGSAIHRLDPRVKLVIAALFVGGAIATTSLVALLLTLGLVLGALALARIPLRYATRGIRPALLFLALLSVLQVLTIPQNDVGTVLWRWWQIVITVTDLHVAALTLTRFVVLILGLCLFSLSTSTAELTHGVEHLLLPLQRIGFPGHELALTLVIALRFVPILALEAERIAKAQASRGADFGRDKMNPFKRARRMIPVLVPLFITALHRAEMLVLAMEARCYTGGKGRTHLIRLQAGQRDLAALVLSGLLIALLIATAWVRVDTFIWKLLW
jgi:energy-coupling factor transport system permease protein